MTSKKENDVAREARSVACADAPGRKEEIQARLSAITPGPWRAGHHANPDHPCNCRYVLCEHYMGAICTVNDAKFGDEEHPPYKGYPPHKEAVANSLFIANAPSDVAFLLEQLKAARSESEDTQAKATPSQDDVDALVKAVGEGISALDLAMEKAPEHFSEFLPPHRALRAALPPFQKG